jgi:NADPH:quinone reductase-like Zn-dependent oxidoreductase
VAFQAGQSVLVLAATGNAGRMAVQVAKLFGANRIVAAARGADRLAELPALGATDTVLLEGDAADIANRLGQAAGDVDVVIDYLWGEPTAAAMIAIVTARADPGKQLTWIEIGAVAGPVAPIPSAALRSTRLQIVGSGQGSVSAREIRAELSELAAEITKGTFAIDAEAVPLAEVEQAWIANTRQRIVFTPQR